MPRLVLADDNLTTQRMVELSLEAEGYEVLPFSDGTEALEYILHNEVDVVLANVSLPGLDGYSLCAQLAEEPDKAGVPVVLLVGALADVEEKKAREADCAATLSKPFSTGGLLEVVTKAREAAAEEPATVSNLFEIPIEGSDEEALFQLSLRQALSSDRTLPYQHLRPSVSDLVAIEAEQKVDRIAKELSRRLPKELSQIIPKLTDKIYHDLSQE